MDIVLNLVPITDLKKILLNHSKNYKITYSNISPQKNLLKIDLEKNLKHYIKYDKVIIFNVLEHVSNYKKLKKFIFTLKNGEIIGSTPFLYQIHGAAQGFYKVY